MAKKIGKLEDGRELFGFDLGDVEVKALGDYELEITGSTGAVDRDNEVLDPNGWDLKNYKKNPVILPAHSYSSPAIARAKSVRVKDGKLNFRIEFPPEGIYPLADTYRGLYKNGFQQASSVGFIPTEWKIGENPKDPSRTYTKQELIELSLVAVPSNPEALTTAKGLGIVKSKEYDEWLKAVEEVFEVFEDNPEDEPEDKPKDGPKDKPKDKPKEPEERPKGVIDLKKAIEDDWEVFKEKILQGIKELQEEGLYKSILFGEVEKNPKADLEKNTIDTINAIKEVFNGGN